MTFVLEDFLPYRLSVAADAISRRFEALYAQEAGLNVAEWRLLAHLADQAPASVRDITQRVGLEKSIVSRAATRLEQRGLIERSAHDGDQRLIALDLSAEGTALMQKLSAIANQFQAELIAELGADAEAAYRIMANLSR